MGRDVLDLHIAHGGPEKSPRTNRRKCPLCLRFVVAEDRCEHCGANLTPPTAASGAVGVPARARLTRALVEEPAAEMGGWPRHDEPAGSQLWPQERLDETAAVVVGQAPSAVERAGYASYSPQNPWESSFMTAIKVAEPPHRADMPAASAWDADGEPPSLFGDEEREWRVVEPAHHGVAATEPGRHEADEGEPAPIPLPAQRGLLGGRLTPETALFALIVLILAVSVGVGLVLLNR